MGVGDKRTRYKKDGSIRHAICSCGYINCDSSHGFMNTPYIRKLRFRNRNNLCIGCGKKACSCKNKNRGLNEFSSKVKRNIKYKK